MELIPIQDYIWTDDYSFMRTLTCRDHPTARYLTKNPFTRGIHLMKIPEGDIQRSANGECICPFSSLVVITEN